MKPRYDANKYLVFFFSITLIWTWTCGFLPVILRITGTPFGTFIFYFGGGAPSVIALFLVFLTYPKKVKEDYFYRCFSIKKVGWKWLLWTILLFSFIAAASIFVGTEILGYKMPGMEFISSLVKAPYMVIIILLLSLVSGPLNEEFGWRGYALDKLLVKYGFLGASLILGFIWAIWHLPWYFTPGQAQYNMLQVSIFNAIMFIPSCTLFSVVVSYIYVKTKRSILAAALVHMISNLLTSQLLSPYSGELGLVIRYISIAVYVIIMLYTLLSKKFKNEVDIQVKQIESEIVQQIACPSPCHRNG